MSVCELMYFISSMLFVLMAVSMVGLVNVCIIVVLVFATEVLVLKAAYLPALCVRFFLFLSPFSRSSCG